VHDLDALGELGGGEDGNEGRHWVFLFFSSLSRSLAKRWDLEFEGLFSEGRVGSSQEVL
jgi:hypothetical protein